VRSHPAQDVERHPAHVDLVAAGHKRWGALDDGWSEPIAAQPVSVRPAIPAPEIKTSIAPRLGDP
jgi:hypothetical protein